MIRPVRTLLLTLTSSLLFSLPTLVSGQQTPRPASAKPETTNTAGIISTYAGNGYGRGGDSGGFTGDGGLATSAELDQPSGVAVDKTGNLFIADLYNNRIRKVEASTHIITTAAGNGILSGPSCSPTAYGYCGDGGQATNAFLYHPEGVAVDAAGDLFIADAGDNAIRKVDAKTQVITLVVGFVPPCSVPDPIISCPPPNQGYTGDGGPATMATLSHPTGVFVSAGGDLYIADSGNLVVRKVTASTGNISTVAGGGLGCLQQTNTFGDGCPATDAKFSLPIEVVADGIGNLYISDFFGGSIGDDRVRKVDVQTGVISTYAGGGEGLGCPLFQNGCLATNAVFFNPKGLVFDASDDLYISDSESIRMVDVTTGLIKVIAGVGYTGFPTLGGLAVNSKVGSPYGMAFDSVGDLFFADTLNQTVFEISSGNTAVPVCATPTFSPAPGTYSGTQPIILSDTTSGAIIYYTVDGSTPTTSSPKYIASIPISSTTTINAYAVASGYTDSAVATGAYTIQTPVPAPGFSTLGGTFTSAQTVTLSDSLSGAAIYYTTNGLTPTTSSTRYNGPITVSATETISAIASESGYTNSAVATEIFTITAPVALPPAFSPAGGTYASAQTVALSDSTSGATIYYTINGSTATTSSTPYTGPITVSNTETISAIAAANGYTNSTAATATYTIQAALPQVTFSPAPGTYTSAQSVTLSDSTAGTTIYYTTDGSSPTASSTKYTGAITVKSTETISAIATETGYNNSAVSAAKYVINLPPVATPTFTPAAGTYTSAQSVTISDSTTGATIYYTKDGSSPTTGSTKYSGPIAVASTETVAVIAVASGYTNSGVGAASYVINLPPADFTISLSSAALTLASGKSATSTLTATPTNGFSQPITFSCSGLPSNDSCSFSPSTITPSGTPATTTLTVAESTTAATRTPSVLWPGAPGGTLAMTFCWLGWRKRRRIGLALFALALMIGLGAFIGCGGVTPSTTSPTLTTYNATLTATSGSISHTTSFTITQ